MLTRVSNVALEARGFSGEVESILSTFPSSLDV